MTSSRWNSIPSSSPLSLTWAPALSMNCIELGVTLKNEMFVVEAADDGDGNFLANMPMQRATSSPLETSPHSPAPWIPFALFQSSTYSSMANDTLGLLRRCRTVADVG